VDADDGGEGAVAEAGEGGTVSDETTIFMCGPSTAECKCECGRGGGCEHDWTGPTVNPEPGLYTVTCARCGMDAFTHSLWTGD
jgi:hypothetical protein